MQLNNILSSTFKGDFKIDRHYIGKEEQTEIFTSLFTLFLTWKNKIFIYLANLVVHYHHFVILQFSIIFVLVLFQMISTFCIRIVFDCRKNVNIAIKNLASEKRSLCIDMGNSGLKILVSVKILASSHSAWRWSLAPSRRRSRARFVFSRHSRWSTESAERRSWDPTRFSSWSTSWTSTSLTRFFLSRNT